MTTRYDLLAVRESNDRAYFTKCGAMFPNKNGDGFNIVLDVMPAPNDGQFRLIAKVPQERDDNPRGRSASADRQQAQSRSRGDGSQGHADTFRADLSDDIPFARNDTVW